MLFRSCCEIYRAVEPKNIVPMWSFIHRRESTRSDMPDRQRRMHFVNATEAQDFENFMLNFDLVQNSCQTNVVNAMIPSWRTTSSIWNQMSWDRLRAPDWPQDVPQTLHEFQSLHPDIVQELQTLHNINIDKLLAHYQTQEKYPAPPGIIETVQVDLARDGLHFDIVTARDTADKISARLL